MSVSGLLFATFYDRVMARTERACLQEHRRALLTNAHGEVLEIGAGTGANLPFYGPTVSRLTVAEPESPMFRRLQRRLAAHPIQAELVRTGAERLPFETGRFDVVVSTLVLCTVSDQATSLSELRRVLRVGGTLLFIEHVRSERPSLAQWQDRLNGLNRRIAHGCNCTRATVETIRQAGFTISQLAHHRLNGAPPTLRPLVVGSALAA